MAFFCWYPNLVVFGETTKSGGFRNPMLQEYLQTMRRDGPEAAREYLRRLIGPTPHSGENW